jgi:hypothetical protein
MRRVFYALSILVTLVLSACQALPPTVFVSPTLAPTTFTSPVPNSDRGSITGVLLRNTSSPISVNDAILYLGSVHLDANGAPILAGLDKQTAPSTQTDKSGRFVFAEVPPGTYVLILDRIHETFLLNDPTSGKDFLIKSQAGQILDLGKLVYASLPGDNFAP